MSADIDQTAHQSDEQLLQRFVLGERPMFGVLLRRYQREIYTYLRRYLRRFVDDPTLADDAFQATFLTLYTKCGQYEDGRPVRPWLYTIATHAAIDLLRRTNRHPAASLDRPPADDQPADGRTLADLVEAREGNPLEACSLEERKVAVRLWVDRLPEFLRQVVILTYFQGLKYREAAEVLNIPVGTVKSRLHAALARLQEAGREVPTPAAD